MTKRLEETFRRVSALPAEDQDMIAAGIEAMLADEAAWDRSFAASQELLGQMAEQVRCDIREGRVVEGGMDQQ